MAPLHVEPLAFTAEHCVPQAPQLFGSVVVGVSQPLKRLVSQSAKPALQLGAHALFTQLLLTVLLSAQAVPHPPQLALLERTSVSQPLFGLLSQLLKYDWLHAGVHTSATQVLTELSDTQAILQPPQLLLSLANTASQPSFALPSQLPNAAPQLGEQAPVTQLFVPCGAWQAVPHAPQLLLLVARFASHPSVSGFMLQSAKFALHLLSWQPPMTHLPDAFRAAYTVVQLRPLLPQPPQLVVLLLVSVWQLTPVPRQSANGGAHALTLHALF